MSRTSTKRTWPLLAALLGVLVLAFIAWQIRVNESSRKKLPPRSRPEEVAHVKPVVDDTATATPQPPTDQPPIDQLPTTQLPDDQHPQPQEPPDESPIKKQIKTWVGILKAPNLRQNIQHVFQLEKGIRAGGEEAVTYLLELLKSEESPIVRSWMVRLLGECGSKTPMPELVRIVRTDHAEGVRICAATALGLIGDESVLDVLNEVAQEDQSTAVTEAARKAIEAIETRLKGQ